MNIKDIDQNFQVLGTQHMWLDVYNQNCMFKYAQQDLTPTSLFTWRHQKGKKELKNFHCKHFITACQKTRWENLHGRSFQLNENILYLFLRSCRRFFLLFLRRLFLWTAILWGTNWLPAIKACFESVYKMFELQIHIY